MIRRKKEPIWVIVLRIALALLFIFSGLTKAVDPIGWGIKMDEYFTSFGMSFMHPYSFYIGFIPTIAEFLLGFMLLFRIKVKWTAIGYLIFMTFFFFLTLWLAIAEHLELNYGYNLGVVKDCGCFGQAIEMSNLETFLKNVVIMIPTIIIFRRRNTIPEIRVSQFGQLMWASIGIILVFAFQLYCLFNLPVVDFSNWKKGNNVVDVFIDIPAKKEMVFLYKNKLDSTKVISLTEEQMMTVTDTLPTFYDDFDYIDREDKITTPAVSAKKTGFTMLDKSGSDFASSFINKEKDHVYILFMHNLNEVSKKGINDPSLLKLIEDCKTKNIDFVGVTNNSIEEIAAFTKKYNITFPIYHNPIDPVKGPFMVRDAIRSNPGLMLIKKGVVAEKWSWRNFPDQVK
jgi:uncharacterized membrane protein YphA (DoxX/SURF4 family)